MKIAIIRNTPQAQVFLRRGRQNREFYEESDIECVRDALGAEGHEVEVLEGDATLIEALRRRYAVPEGAFPDDLFVFNLAYGVQGECRYTHIPSLLEMLGVPYLCSGPRSHTLSLDKYLAKILIERAGLPTPAFQLLTSPADELEDNVRYPVVVKPQFESTSFGLRIVESRGELEGAASAVMAEFSQPVLVETFIEGREVNCGILGNDPPAALPVVEIDLGNIEGSKRVVTFDAKKDRVVGHKCPADLSAGLTAAVQDLAVRTFRALGCYDCARVDFRIDEAGGPWILELNSMAAVHPHGSYYFAAKTLGWSYQEMIRRLLETALARYNDARRP